MKEQMTLFNQDLKNLIDKHPALKNGEITSTYKDHGNLVHIHRLQKDDENLNNISPDNSSFLNNSDSSARKITVLFR